jgi:HAD superfamily hydrolase (TIGR01549 family)
MPGRDRAVLFDLFGTLVRFEGRRLPMLDTPQGPVRSTVPAFAPLLREIAPNLSPAAFHAALVEVSLEIARVQRETHREVPSWRRFARALEAVEVNGAELEAYATRLSAAHMKQLAAVVFVPDGHVEILERLKSRLATGCISNFDHAPTASRILEETGLAPLLGTVVISDAFGWRKPFAGIFEEALSALHVAPAEATFVGDSYEDDVCGATAVGLRPVWLRRKRDVVGPADVGAVLTISELTEVEGLLRE